MLLFELVYLRFEHFLLGHRHIRLVGQWREQQFDNKYKYEDDDPVVGDVLLQKFKDRDDEYFVEEGKEEPAQVYVVIIALCDPLDKVVIIRTQVVREAYTLAAEFVTGYFIVGFDQFTVLVSASSTSCETTTRCSVLLLPMMPM